MAGGARLPLLAAGAVVWNATGEVVLIRRGRPPRLGEWSIPGGKVEWGETLAETVLREVREETGLIVELIGRIDIVDSLIRGEHGEVAHHHVLVDYSARVVSGELRAAGDAAEAHYVSYDRLGQFEMWPETRRVIDISRSKHIVES